MTADQRFLAIGVYINSALYLAGVFTAGVLFAHPWAWKLALMAAGFAYLTYLAQLMDAAAPVQGGLFGLSALAGFAAGVILLF